MGGFLLLFNTRWETRRGLNVIGEYKARNRLHLLQKEEDLTGEAEKPEHSSCAG